MNPYFKLVLGFFFCFLGYCYLYKISVIYRINKIIKENFLNDSYTALIREKAALFFWLFGLLLIYMGLIRII